MKIPPEEIIDMLPYILLIIMVANASAACSTSTEELNHFLDEFQEPTWWASKPCIPKSIEIYRQADERGMELCMVMIVPHEGGIGHSINAVKVNNRWVFIENSRITGYCLSRWGNCIGKGYSLPRKIIILENITFQYIKGIVYYYHGDLIESFDYPYSSIPGDINIDGRIDIGELLYYIKLWARGNVDDFDLLFAVRTHFYSV